MGGREDVGQSEAVAVRGDRLPAGQTRRFGREAGGGGMS